MTIMKKHLWAYNQRVHALPYGGRSQILARSIRATTGSTGGESDTLIVVPDGQVALFDKIEIAAVGEHVTPPQVDYIVLVLEDTNNEIRCMLPVFLTGFTVTTAYSPLGTSVLGNQPIMWEPQVPLMVPSGWTLKVMQQDLGAGATPTTPSTTTTHGAHIVQCYGIVVSEDDARGAGYDVNNTGAQASRNWIQTGSYLEVFSPDQDFGPGAALSPMGSGSSNAATAFAPARTNNCILITDLLVRLAPSSPAGSGGISLRQTDGTVLFEWYNSQVSQTLTRVIRPRIYTEPGVGLEVHCLGSPSTDTSSVIMLGRYVPADQVPTDAWWSRVAPPFPSGGLTSPDDASTAFTLNYPTGSPAGSFDTRISPGDGLVHVLEGYEVSVQKTSETDTGPVFFALTSGPTAGTGLLANVGTAIPVSGWHSIQLPGEMISYGTDKLALECVPDNGMLIVDVDRSAALYASPGTDAGLENWSFTVWGRTKHSTRRSTGGDLTNFRGTD